MLIFIFFFCILHFPADQFGMNESQFLLPSQVQTAPLHQSTVSLTQPPVTACTMSTNLTPPEMTTPPEPHMVAHTGVSLVTELPVSLVPMSCPASPHSTVSK